MRMVVTGAAGFVGREVCAELVAAGVDVRGLVRNRAVTGQPGLDAVEEIRVRDLLQAADDGRLLAGAEVVIHLAARVHHPGETGSAVEQLYTEQNEDLTRRLAESAVRSGVRHFIYMSSVKAIGERSSAVALKPEDLPHPQDAYGRSKLGAERQLARIGAASGMAISIIRPPLVYGPGAGANFRQLVRWVARGVPLPFGAIRNQRSLVSVWNLAAAVVRCGTAAAVGCRVLHVADRRPVSTAELVGFIAQGAGRRPRLWSMRPALLDAVLRAVGRASLADRLLGSLTLDTRSSETALGWAPAIAVEDGVVRAVAEMLR